MLKEFPILAIALIAIFASRITLSQAAKSTKIGDPVLLEQENGSCRASRKDCNVCGCDRRVPVCTIIFCDSLPPAVKNGNAVANTQLPSWPGNLDDAVSGQVYRWHIWGFCVKTSRSSAFCASGI